MIDRIGRVPGPSFPDSHNHEIPPVEPADSVVPQKRDSDTVEISEKARKLLKEARREKEELENGPSPEEESLE